ncbi:hypothetical protein KAR91_36080 [Candidatus Pacearchaeota archaeon]|nr:hypothetical protein [Candidatus Pacearchaeota archaeon]
MSDNKELSTKEWLARIEEKLLEMATRVDFLWRERDEAPRDEIVSLGERVNQIDGKYLPKGDDADDDRECTMLEDINILRNIVLALHKDIHGEEHHEGKEKENPDHILERLKKIEDIIRDGVDALLPQWLTEKTGAPASLLREIQPKEKEVERTNLLLKAILEILCRDYDDNYDGDKSNTICNIKKGL